MERSPHKIAVCALAAAFATAGMVAPAGAAHHTKVKLRLVGKLGPNGAAGPVTGAPCVKGRFVSKLLPPKINYVIKCKGGTMKLQATVALSGSDVSGTWKSVSGTGRYKRMHGGGPLKGSLQAGKAFVLTGSVTGI